MISVLRFAGDVFTAVGAYFDTLAIILEPSEYRVTITPPREAAVAS